MQPARRAPALPGCPCPSAARRALRASARDWYLCAALACTYSPTHPLICTANRLHRRVPTTRATSSLGPDTWLSMCWDDQRHRAIPWPRIPRSHFLAFPFPILLQSSRQPPVRRQRSNVTLDPHNRLLRPMPSSTSPGSSSLLYQELTRDHMERTTSSLLCLQVCRILEQLDRLVADLD